MIELAGRAPAGLIAHPRSARSAGAILSAAAIGIRTACRAEAGRGDAVDRVVVAAARRLVAETDAAGRAAAIVGCHVVGVGLLQESAVSAASEQRIEC